MVPVVDLVSKGTDLSPIPRKSCLFFSTKTGKNAEMMMTKVIVVGCTLYSYALLLHSPEDHSTQLARNPQQEASAVVSFS